MPSSCYLRNQLHARCGVTSLQLAAAAASRVCRSWWWCSDCWRPEPPRQSAGRTPLLTVYSPMLADAAHLQDVYTAIAIRVRQKMQEDADNGHPLAARLVDAVDRKLVKQVGRLCPCCTCTACSAHAVASACLSCGCLSSRRCLVQLGQCVLWLPSTGCRQHCLAGWPYYKKGCTRSWRIFASWLRNLRSTAETCLVVD